MHGFLFNPAATTIENIFYFTLIGPSIFVVVVVDFCCFVLYVLSFLAFALGRN